MAKDNTTLYIAIGAVAIGYFAYKNGLLAKFGIPAPAKPVAVATLPGQTQGGLQSAQSVALELPNVGDITVPSPTTIDVTGEQLNFY